MIYTGENRRLNEQELLEKLVKNFEAVMSGGNSLNTTGGGGGTVTLNTSDLQIGAVEIKDATTSNRLVVNTNGALLVSQSSVDQATAVKSYTLQSGASALGNGTPADVSGYNTIFFNVIISGTATVSFEVSSDNSNWYSTSGFTSTAGQVISSTTASGAYRFNVSGVKYIRARISAYTSGTVDVTGNASVGITAFVPNSIVSNVDGAASGLYGQLALNYLYGFNGTTWDRLRVDANKYLQVASMTQQYITPSADGVASGAVTSANGSYLFGFNGTTWDRVKTVNTGQLRATPYSSSGLEAGIFNVSTGITDGSALGVGGLVTASVSLGFNGTGFDRVRVGKVYKYIEYLNLANATATTVWTPATGKKIRIMAVSISTGSSGNKFHLRTGTAGSGTAFYTFRSTGTSGDTQSFNFGNGFLATNANDVLEVYNVSGVTADVWVTAWGTEE